jgi:sensor c-di-GMP phosphodiesterase-like protein
MITAADVKAALYSGEMFLEYLPVVALSDRHCFGAEALIRWRRGGRIVQPAEFIPLIENTPVSGLLTYWVVDTVAKDLAQWLRAHEDAHIAINVPPEVLGRGGLRYAAMKSGILDLVSRFIIEITERGLPDKMGIEEVNTRSDVLVALDDACANENGLVVASRVHVDILKIEKSTVDRITGQEFSPTEMSTLATLIRSAKVTVIAEGVEHEAQVRKLQDCGIGMAQGWLFSRPLSADAFKEYFLVHREAPCGC